MGSLRYHEGEVEGQREGKDKIRRNTYVLFNLERSHDSIFIESREVVL
jgi:hypothetical protein